MNTQGYLLPGGTCQISCYDENCDVTGTIKVTFYPPLEDNSTDMVTMLIDAPYLCLYDSFTVTACCQNLIRDHTLVWMKVELENDLFTVERIALTNPDNAGIYLALGLALLLTSLFLFGCIIGMTFP